MTLHYSFFAKDYPDEPLGEGEYAEACRRIDQEYKIHQQLQKLNNKLLAVLKKYDEAENAKEKQAHANDATEIHTDLMDKAREYLEVIQLMKQFVEAACLVMQSEMDGSKVR